MIDSAGQDLPRRAGRYELVRVLSHGGMGTVFLARTEGVGGFEKWVALKRPHAHLVNDGLVSKMFLNEAKLVARLEHENICPILDYDVDEEGPYFVMPYLHGRPFSEIMAHVATLSEVPYPLIAHFAACVCAGLHYAHNLVDEDGTHLGLIHRDVSPHNVMVTFSGSVKVLDFGLAKAIGNDGRPPEGQPQGKAAYMSPEQARGEPLSPSSDMFSLGVILWETLARQRLFRRNGLSATLVAVGECEIPDLTSVSPGVPERLATVVSRALARDPGARFDDVRDMGRELRKFIRQTDQFFDATEVAAFMHLAFPTEADLSDPLSAPEHTGPAATVDLVIRSPLVDTLSPTPLEDDGRSARVSSGPAYRAIPSSPSGPARRSSSPSSPSGPARRSSSPSSPARRSSSSRGGAAMPGSGPESPATGLSMTSSRPTVPAASLEPYTSSAPTSAVEEAVSSLPDEHFSLPPRNISMVPRRHAGRNKLVAAVVALLAASIGLFMLAVSAGPVDDSADRALRALYDRGEFAAVTAYYEADGRTFADPDDAAKLVTRARKALDEENDAASRRTDDAPLGENPARSHRRRRRRRKKKGRRSRRAKRAAARTAPSKTAAPSEVSIPKLVPPRGRPAARPPARVAAQPRVARVERSAPVKAAAPSAARSPRKKKKPVRPTTAQPKASARRPKASARRPKASARRRDKPAVRRRARRKPAAAPRRVVAAPDAPAPMERAREFEQKGRRALLSGDLQTAERSLKSCLGAAAYPPCHRLLGVLYANEKRNSLAVKHYVRYIQLRPDAPDAGRIRQLVQSYRRR